MWLDDLALFAYESEPQAGRMAVGWLDGAHQFECGEVGSRLVHERFVEVLRWAAVHRSVDGFRGFHYCDLGGCDQAFQKSEELPVASSAGHQVTLGSAQIEVDGGDGRRYVAPNLIVHYVEDHGYRPPEVFVRAALVGDWRSPDRAPGTYRFVGPGVAIDEWSPELGSVLWERLAERLGSTTAEVRDLVRVDVRPSEFSCLHTRKGLPAVAVVMTPTASSWVKARNWIPTVPGTGDIAAWIAEALTRSGR